MENYEYIVLYDYYDNNVDLENNMFYGMRVAKKTLIYSVQELKKDGQEIDIKEVPALYIIGKKKYVYGNEMYWRFDFLEPTFVPNKVFAKASDSRAFMINYDMIDGGTIVNHQNGSISYDKNGKEIFLASSNNKIEAPIDVDERKKRIETNLDEFVGENRDNMLKSNRNAGNTIDDMVLQPSFEGGMFDPAEM